MVLLWPGDASLCLSGCKFKNLFWIIQSFFQMSYNTPYSQAIRPLRLIGPIIPKYR